MKTHQQKLPSKNKYGPEYYRIHAWINHHYGKASYCSNDKCIGKSKNYAWALVKGKIYEKNIENYIQMCYSCHIKYDLTEEIRENARIRMTGKPMPESTKKKMSEVKKGKTLDWIKKKILFIDEMGNETVFNSVNEASEGIGLNRSTIWKWCNKYVINNNSKIRIQYANKRTENN